MAGAKLGHLFVLEADNLPGQIAVGPVPNTKLSDADGLNVNSGLVHVGQAGLHAMRVQLRVRNGQQPFEVLGLLGVFDDIPNFCDSNVRVNINRPNTAAGNYNLPASIRLETQRRINKAATNEQNSRA